MTVKELKEKLKTIPEHMEVYINKTNDEHECSFVEQIMVKEMSFEDSDETEKCLIITDEI